MRDDCVSAHFLPYKQGMQSTSSRFKGRLFKFTSKQYLDILFVPQTVIKYIWTLIFLTLNL